MDVGALDIEIEKVESSRLSETDFSNLTFGREFSDHMLVANFENGKWSRPKIQPFKEIAMSPAACVFHYGQAIFEGLKACRSIDGELLLFRPEKNFERMNASARRMCMAEIPENIFINGIKELINLDRDWVPKTEGHSLYIRPFLIASDGFLGVKPSSNYKFMVITSPTSKYYSGTVKVKVEERYTRAAEGGIGAAKAAANYAASLLPAKTAQEEGYDQLIWTDAKTHTFIEESGTMNIMFLINGTLITPSLESGTILPGITRDSILTLAKDWGIKVEVRKVKVEEVIEAIKYNLLEEAFGAGTAATIAPISTIGYRGVDYSLSNSEDWSFANKIRKVLSDIKVGNSEDNFGWITKV